MIVPTGYCDICGARVKTLDELSGTIREVNLLMMDDVMVSIRDGGANPLDVCPDCRLAIKRALEDVFKERNRKHDD